MWIIPKGDGQSKRNAKKTCSTVNNKKSNLPVPSLRVPERKIRQTSSIPSVKVPGK